MTRKKRTRGDMFLCTYCSVGWMPELLQGELGSAPHRRKKAPGANLDGSGAGGTLTQPTIRPRDESRMYKKWGRGKRGDGDLWRLWEQMGPMNAGGAARRDAPQNNIALLPPAPQRSAADQYSPGPIMWGWMEVGSLKARGGGCSTSSSSGLIQPLP